jgi:hypothetical protein
MGWGTVIQRIVIGLIALAFPVWMLYYDFSTIVQEPYVIPFLVVVFGCGGVMLKLAWNAYTWDPGPYPGSPEWDAQERDEAWKSWNQNKPPPS